MRRNNLLIIFMLFLATLYSQTYVKNSAGKIYFEPVIIKSDVDLKNYASQGDGTAENPLIIEGMNIDLLTGTTGLSINSTSAYAIFRNLIVRGASFRAIEVIGSSNLIFENILVVGNNVGIYSTKSTISIIQSQIENNTLGMLALGGDAIIQNSTIKRSQQYGLILEEMERAEIKFNRFVSNGLNQILNSSGLVITSSTNIEVFNNDFINNTGPSQVEELYNTIPSRFTRNYYSDFYELDVDLDNYFDARYPIRSNLNNYDDRPSIVPNIMTDIGKIKIESDQEMKQFAQDNLLWGNGTIDFPYRIASFNVQNFLGRGIEIYNTRVYIEIRSNYFGRHINLHPTYLKNTTNINTYRNYFNRSYSGITYIDSSNFNIELNTFLEVKRSAIELIDTSSVVFTKNKIIRAQRDYLGGNAVYIKNLNSSLIKNNYITQSSGFYIENIRAVRIIGNEIIAYSPSGIRVIRGIDLYVEGNKISKINLNALSFAFLNNSIISNNQVYESEFGISVNRGYNNTLTKNNMTYIRRAFHIYNTINSTLENNEMLYGRIGIYADYSAGLSIFNNTFTRTSEEGIKIQHEAANISYNTFINLATAIYLLYVDNNLIEYNYISYYGDYAIKALLAVNQTIIHNDFFKDWSRGSRSKLVFQIGSPNTVINNFYDFINNTDSDGDGYTDQPFTAGYGIIIDPQPLANPITLDNQYTLAPTGLQPTFFQVLSGVTEICWNPALDKINRNLYYSVYLYDAVFNEFNQTWTIGNSSTLLVNNITDTCFEFNTTRFDNRNGTLGYKFKLMTFVENTNKSFEIYSSGFQIFNPIDRVKTDIVTNTTTSVVTDRLTDVRTETVTIDPGTITEINTTTVFEKLSFQPFMVLLSYVTVMLVKTKVKRKRERQNQIKL